MRQYSSEVHKIGFSVSVRIFNNKIVVGMGFAEIMIYADIRNIAPHFTAV
jgi:hypothetical protein